MLSQFQSLIEPIKALFVQLLEDDEEGQVFTDMTAVEREVRCFAQGLGNVLLQAFVDTRSTQAKQNEQLRRCQRGHRMELNRNSTWTRKTLFGEIIVPDFYVYCRKCKESARPLHAFLGTDVERWSLVAQETIVDLCSDESCGKSAEKFARLFPGVRLDRSVGRHFLQQHGKRAREFVERKLRRAAAEGNAETCALELEVEVDGGMVPVATLSEIERKPGEEPETTPVRHLPKRKKVCRYEEVRIGLVQSPKSCGDETGKASRSSRQFTVRANFELNEVFEDLYALGRSAGLVDGHTQVRGIADGAPYIRQRMEKTFESTSFKFILDRPHAKEHLSEAAKALYPNDATVAEAWATRALSRLENGEAAEVVTELRAAWKETGSDVLRCAAGYFERHGDAVEYAAYRDKGWSTASSEVESAHRYIVQVRLKISGAWWDPENVPNILALRMLKANGWWNEYWAEQRANWEARAATLRRVA